MSFNNAMVNSLISIADDLDERGLKKEAKMVDEFLKKYAKELFDRQDEPDSEQAKRYDTKHHHDSLVEIKDNKIVDYDGRGKHHVTEYQEDAGMLRSRYCPDHVGVMVGRISENTFQCSEDGAIYNWEVGFTDHNGNNHPGGSISEQTPGASGHFAIPSRVFDSRERVLNPIS